MIFSKAALCSTALGLLLLSPFVRAEPATVVELAPEIAQDFVRPHTLLDVGGGRKMHLYCRGEGATTVIFDAGLSDWSSIWALVQPQIASRTRACTYDRAGMGYSDPSARPSTPFNVVEDLRNLMKAAGIHSPVVLVGHSLGGFNMKLFAATYPSEVAGVVLVDPTEELELERARPVVTAKFGAATFNKMYAEENGPSAWLAHFQVCVDAAKKQDLDPLSDLYKQCTDPVRQPLGSLIAQHRQTLQVRYVYQAAQASEALNCVIANNPALDAQYSRIFGKKNALGNLPLIVLSHGLVDMESPFPQEDQYVLLALHDQTTALSTRGRHRVVPNTHHNIEVDDPHSIVVAINEVLEMLPVAL
ncbi:alpha/beta fold hydrolase [Duganella qianjiadongensis]|uniref:Alpha/beta fold hydrolase n=1 Tax=Duganella qianjiadongensis TaxID=2692176 RepID=A0ABW9VQI6_9BURK|nr:alpha/beta hydrolase [Duganella qianjiadongensis]MYM39977.1 alpha/beta fold hydrolase [Duganella qianjiadongensis]